MSNYSWDVRFLDLFNRCVKRYQGGDRDFTKYYGKDDLAFLKSIGCKTREFFDFVEDYANGEDPSPTTAVLVAAVRRDYLRTVMKGEFSDVEIDPDTLPAKSDELSGIRWLPRIIKKAEAKLRGELDPDVMYGCGGDRMFLDEHDIHMADFLRVVWAAQGNAQYVVDYVKRKGS